MSDLQMLALGLGISLFVILCLIAFIVWVDYKMDEENHDKEN